MHTAVAIPKSSRHFSGRFLTQQKNHGFLRFFCKYSYFRPTQMVGLKDFTQRAWWTSRTFVFSQALFPTCHVGKWRHENFGEFRNIPEIISPTRLCLKTLSEPGTPFFGPKIYHLFVVDLRNSIIEHGHLWTCHPIIIKYQFCPIELSPFSNTQATLGPVPWREWRHDALSAWQVSWRMDSYERHQTNSYILRIVWQPTK